MKTVSLRSQLTTLIVASSILFGSVLATGSQSSDVTKQEPPIMVIDNIPASWDYYYLPADIIEENEGDEVKEVCMDDDFSATPDAYANLTERRRPARSRARPGFEGTYETTRIKLLKGMTDFRVIGEKKIILQSPFTGKHIIETGGCKKNIRLAKYIHMNSANNRRRVNQCLRRSEQMVIQMRRRGGIQSCKIETIHTWKGAFPDDQ